MGSKQDELAADVERTRQVVSMLIMLGLGVYCGRVMGKQAGAREARTDDREYKLLRRLAVIEDKLEIKPEGMVNSMTGPLPVRIVED